MIGWIFAILVAALGTPILAIPFSRRHRGAWLLAQLSLLVAGALTLFLAVSSPGAEIFSGEAEIDPLSMALLFLGVVDAILAVHGSGEAVAGYPDPAGYYSVALLAVLGIVGIAVSNSVTLLMASWILFSVASFALVALPKDRYSVASAVKYAIMGSASSILLFLSFGIILFVTGSLYFTEAKISYTSVLAPALLFLIAAIGFKMGVFPFHGWLPDTYGDADPVPIAYISSLAKIAGILALYRAAKIIAGPLSWNWLTIVAVFAIATMTYGNITALLQEEAQRLLAYSSIAQAGYLLVGVAALASVPGINMEWAYYGLAFQLAAYAFAKTGTFLAVRAARARGEAPVKLRDLAGLYLKHPVLAAAFATLIFSLMGMPPLAGFWGKLYLFLSVAGPAPWLTAAALINTGIAAAYYVRAIKAVYFEEGVGEFHVPPSLERAVALCAAATVATGLLPFILFFL